MPGRRGADKTPAQQSIHRSGRWARSASLHLFLIYARQAAKNLPDQMLLQSDATVCRGTATALSDNRGCTAADSLPARYSPALNAAVAPLVLILPAAEWLINMTRLQ